MTASAAACWYRFVLPSGRSLVDAEELLSSLEQRLKTLSSVDHDKQREPLAAAHEFLRAVQSKSGNILQYVVDPNNEVQIQTH
jgi:hypothetical protein